MSDSTTPTVTGPSVVIRNLRPWVISVMRGEQNVLLAVVVAASRQEAEWMCFDHVEEYVPQQGDLIIVDELKADREARVVLAVFTEVD